MIQIAQQIKEPSSKTRIIIKILYSILKSKRLIIVLKSRSSFYLSHSTKSIHRPHLKSNKPENHNSCSVHKSLKLWNHNFQCTKLNASRILTMSSLRLGNSSPLAGHSRTLETHNGHQMYSSWRHPRTTLSMIDGLQRWTWSQDSRLPSSSTSRLQHSLESSTWLSH